jgi:hypothetical protein
MRRSLTRILTDSSRVPSQLSQLSPRGANCFPSSRRADGPCCPAGCCLCAAVRPVCRAPVHPRARVSLGCRGTNTTHQPLAAAAVSPFPSFCRCRCRCVSVGRAPCCCCCCCCLLTDSCCRSRRRQGFPPFHRLMSSRGKAYPSARSSGHRSSSRRGGDGGGGTSRTVGSQGTARYAAQREVVSASDGSPAIQPR